MSGVNSSFRVVRCIILDDFSSLYADRASVSLLNFFNIGFASAVVWGVLVVMNVARCASVARTWGGLESVSIIILTSGASPMNVFTCATLVWRVYAKQLQSALSYISRCDALLHACMLLNIASTERAHPFATEINGAPFMSLFLSFRGMIWRAIPSVYVVSPSIRWAGPK